MKKELGEAVELMVKGISVIQKLEGMGISEKRELKRRDESVKEYEERIRRVNGEAVVVAMKMIVEG